MWTAIGRFRTAWLCCAVLVATVLFAVSLDCVPDPPAIQHHGRELSWLAGGGHSGAADWDCAGAAGYAAAPSPALGRRAPAEGLAAWLIAGPVRGHIWQASGASPPWLLDSGSPV